MAWTRVEGSEIGAEPGDVLEWITIGGAGNPTISTTKKNTGERSISQSGTANVKSAGRAFTAAVMVRASVWLNHNGPQTTSSGNYRILFRWVSTAGNTNYIRWNNNTDVIEVVVNNSVITSVAAGTVGISNVDTWYSLGILIYADASAGWVSFYVGTQPKIQASGLNTGTSILELYFGGSISNGYAASPYFDDFYIDTSTIEEADESPIPHRFLWFIANGNGASSDFVGSDADSTDNFELVDDLPPDADTTYVMSEAAAAQDLYAMSNITVPSGYQVTAVIPKPMCKRAGTTETLKLQLYDGALTAESGEKAPPSSYGFVSHRFPLAPDDSAWDETKVNAIQAGYETAGTF